MGSKRDRRSSGVKGFLKFVLIFAVILLLSAFLAPILYDFFLTFHRYKFERIFNRLVMIGALLAVVLFVRFKKEIFTAYGMGWKPQSFGLFLKGFGTGLLTLGAVAVLSLLSGRAVYLPASLSRTAWMIKLTGVFGTALLIGTMEEFFFRGFIFRSLLKALKNRLFPSVLIATAFYSIIHFIGMKKIFIGEDPGFVDGLRLIGAPFVSLAAWPQFWPQAVGLFLFGLALIGAVYRSGSLYPAIGLHAGSVFFLRLDDFFVEYRGGQAFFWGSKILYDGVLSWIFLSALAVFLWIFLKPSGTDVPPSPSGKKAVSYNDPTP